MFTLCNTKNKVFILKDTRFGARLKTLRNRLELTQVVASQKIGISYKALQDHEGGRRPNRNNLRKYLGFYRCDEAWLLTGVREPFPGKKDEGIPIKEPVVLYNARKREGEKKSTEISGVESLAGIQEQFKLSEALTMVARVLESGTSYATALYVNIQHFDRAIQAEKRIANLEQKNNGLEKRLNNLEVRLFSDKIRESDDLSKKDEILKKRIM